MRQSLESRVYEGADVIDSRDIIARIEELEACEETEGEEFSEDDAEELKALRALADEASSSPGWAHGESLISDDYFEDYARQLAEDIGAVNTDSTWPNCFIDWKAAAESLQQDYFSVEYGSTTYWIRA